LALAEVSAGLRSETIVVAMSVRYDGRWSVGVRTLVSRLGAGSEREFGPK
jgi:hypothetical protein